MGFRTQNFVLLSAGYSAKSVQFHKSSSARQRGITSLMFKESAEWRIMFLQQSCTRFRGAMQDGTLHADLSSVPRVPGRVPHLSPVDNIYWQVARRVMEGHQNQPSQWYDGGPLPGHFIKSLHLMEQMEMMFCLQRRWKTDLGQKVFLDR